MNSIIENQLYSQYRKWNDMRESSENKKIRGRKAKIHETAEGFKECAKCGRVLPADLNNFYRNKQNIGGLHSYCKDCKKQVNRDHIASRKERFYR